jgi:hypothetical protein
LLREASFIHSLEMFLSFHYILFCFFCSTCLKIFKQFLSVYILVQPNVVRAISDQLKKENIDSTVARMKVMGNAQKLSPDKSEWKRCLWRHALRLENNIKGDLKDILWEDVDSTHVVYNRVQSWTVSGTVLNLRGLHKKAKNFLTIWASVCF